MNPASLTDALLAMGVPVAMAEGVPELPADAEALMVYGSRARGDPVETSDLDVLALVGTSRPSADCGDVSVSYYTRGQLSTGIGTLFGAHLKRDGVILWDRRGHLADAVAAMGEVDTERLLGRAKAMTSLFTTRDRDLPKYLPGLLRQARYLLRSCLYAQAIADGAPCFSVRELAERHGDSRLSTLLASRQPDDPAVADLDECLARLRRIVGAFPNNEHGSLEATIVNLWGTSSDVLSMAFMALGITGLGTDYAEVEKILL